MMVGLGWRRDLLVGLAFALTPGVCAGVVADSASSRIADLEISGRVVDSAGKAVPGAQVELGGVEREGASVRRWLDGSAAPLALAHGETAVDGRFLLRAPSRGFVLVTVRASGFVPMRFLLAPLFGAVELPELRLAADQPLTVKVDDAAGKALAGALVVGRPSNPLWRDGGAPERWEAAERQAVTGPAGSARLARAAGERLDVGAVARGKAVAHIADIGGDALTLQLAADRTQVVEVHGPQNDPRAGALLLDARLGLPCGVTAANGRATLAVPARRPVALRLLAEQTVPTALLLSVEAPPSVVRVRLKEVSRMSGRVLDAHSRAAVPGAFVWPSGRPADAVSTDAQGRFTLAIGEPAELETAHAEYAPRRSPSPEPGEERTVLLDAIATLAGRVVDGAGRPIAAAQVDVGFDGKPRFGPSPWSRSRPASGPVLSDTDGRFRASGLLAGTGYLVSVHHAEYAPGELAVWVLPEGQTPPVTLTLRGGVSATLTVVDEKGQPVAGADARLVPAPSGRAGFLSIHRPGDTLRAVSGPSGVLSWQHLAAGRYAIDVKARGFVPALLPGGTLPEQQTRKPVDFGTARLRAGVELLGRVVDPAGNAVAGAHVWASPEPENSYSTDGLPSAVTAADGSFGLVDLAAGAPLVVRAHHRELGNALATGVVAPAAQPLRLTLTPLANVRGRVVDGAGKPVEGAALEINATSGPWTLLDHELTAVSDAEGRFTIAAVPPGGFHLHVAAPGLLPELLMGLDTSAEPLEIVLRPACRVRGVVRGGDGAPLSDVRVWLDDSRHGRSGDGWSFTDGDGRYVLNAVPPGPSMIHAESEEWGETAVELAVIDGDNELDLKLARGVSVSGRVLDMGGLPLPGASVRLAALARPPGPSSDRHTAAGANGEFEFRGVRDGEHRLVAEVDGRANALRQIAVHGVDLEEVDLHLDRGSTIVGQLRGLSADEVTQAMVSAFSVAAGPPGRDGSIDSSGGYRIANLAPGEWWVSASTTGDRQTSGRATVAEGGADVALDLEFPPKGVTLSGHVHVGTAPLRQGFVSATAVTGETSADGGIPSAMTDSEGRFHFSNLAPGSYRLGVGGPSLGEYEEIVEVEEDREVALSIPAGGVQGRVVDADGSTPLAGAKVFLDSTEVISSAHQVRLTADAEGRFRADNVAVGAWTAGAELDGFAGAGLPVEIGEGREAEVEIALQRTDGLALDVTGPLGPVRSAMVAVLALDGSIVAASHLVASETGRVRMPTIPPGTYEVLVAAEGLVPADRVMPVSGATAVPVLLAAGGTLRIRIPAMADSGVRTRARLLGADGRPFRAPYANIVRETWMVWAGAAEIDGVPPGKWTLQVSAEDGRTWTAAVEAAPGATVNLVLE